MAPAPNPYDLKGALERACHPMLAWLDPEYDHHPTLGYEVAHDTGRWWGAAPRLEQAIGWTVPPDIEAAMQRNLRERTDNPDAVLLTDDRFPHNRSRVNPHNLRETMLAYDALVRHRDSDWARQAGHRFLETLDRCLLPDGHLDRMALAIAADFPMSDDGSLAEREDPDEWFDATPTTGRAIEPIMQFYLATGDGLALDVATRLAEGHLARMVDDDLMAIERFWAPHNHGHNHSYLGALRGLLLYGLTTGQERYVRAVGNVYRHSIWQHNIERGCWTPHDLGLPAWRRREKGEEPGGESGSSSDIVQLALWLALHDRQADLFADVEDIIRTDHIGRQVREWDLGVVRQDGRTITERWLGGWGCMIDRDTRDCTFDVHAAVIYTLCEVYANIVTHHEHHSRVNLHFGFVDDHLTVVAADGLLRVAPKCPRALWLRVPRDVEELTASHPYVRAGVYACFAPTAEPVELRWE